MQIDEEVKSTIEESKEVTAKLSKARDKATAANREFEVVKTERYKRFMSSLDHIRAELDISYKAII